MILQKTIIMNIIFHEILKFYLKNISRKYQLIVLLLIKLYSHKLNFHLFLHFAFNINIKIL